MRALIAHIRQGFRDAFGPFTEIVREEKMNTCPTSLADGLPCTETEHAVNAYGYTEHANGDTVWVDLSER